MNDSVIALIAFSSRFVLLLFNILVDILFIDHNAHDVAYFHSVVWWLQPFTKWDAAHYLNVASKDGHQSEMETAFMPTYPFVIKTVGRFISTPLVSILNYEDCLVLAALCINIASFIASSLVLVRLMKHWKIPQKLQNDAFWLHIFNPANVFFVTAYTEALFSCFSWAAVLLLEQRLILGSSILFLAASFIRSNGILNAVFPTMLALDYCVSRINARVLVSGDVVTQRAEDGLQLVRYLLLLMLAALSTVLPHFIMDRRNHLQLCSISDSYASENSQVCIGNASQLYYNSYGYVQKKFWGVGFLRYYHWKQIPNFIMAFPILSIAMHTLFRFSRAESASCIHIGHFVHLAAHVILATGWAHIQISTRLLCSSCPVIYVGFAYLFEYWQLKKHRLATFLLILFVASYNVIGSILHSNFYPFT